MQTRFQMCFDSLTHSAWPAKQMPGDFQARPAACLSLAPSYIDISPAPGLAKTGCPTCGQIPKNAIEQQPVAVVGVLRLLFVFFFWQLPKVYLSCHCATCSELRLLAARAFLAYPVARMEYARSVGELQLPTRFCSHYKLPILLLSD